MECRLALATYKRSNSSSQGSYSQNTTRQGVGTCTPTPCNKYTCCWYRESTGHTVPARQQAIRCTCAAPMSAGVCSSLQPAPACTRPVAPSPFQLPLCHACVANEMGLQYYCRCSFRGASSHACCAAFSNVHHKSQKYPTPAIKNGRVVCLEVISSSHAVRRIAVHCCVVLAPLPPDHLARLTHALPLTRAPCTTRNHVIFRTSTACRPTELPAQNQDRLLPSPVRAG